jgi:hypothetical protein
MTLTTATSLAKHNKPHSLPLVPRSSHSYYLRFRAVNSRCQAERPRTNPKVRLGPRSLNRSRRSCLVLLLKSKSTYAIVCDRRHQVLICLHSRKDDYAFFLQPVDVSQVPGYSDVIKRPMDLGTISTKVNRGKYRSLEEFTVRLIYPISTFCPT